MDDGNTEQDGYEHFIESRNRIWTGSGPRLRPIALGCRRLIGFVLSKSRGC